MIEAKSKQNRWYLSGDVLGSYALILTSACVAIAFAVIANQRRLTQFEGTILQALSLFAGLIGSYIFGKQSAKQAAKELIKPHARSAFRRLMSLYLSLSRLAKAIEKGQQDNTSVKNGNMILEKLEAIVVEQITTADDALEDWRDIVPEDVEGLICKLDKVRNNNE